jgi:hypothetical protein
MGRLAWQVRLALLVRREIPEYKEILVLLARPASKGQLA